MRTFVLVAFILSAAWFAWDSRSPRSEFVDTTHGQINQTLEQPKEPTEEQKRRGREALRRWLSSGRVYRNRLADDIVAGKTLVGLSPKQVLDQLGKPWYMPEVPSSKIAFLEFSCADRESECHLCVKFEDGAAAKSYLSVNY